MGSPELALRATGITVWHPLPSRYKGMKRRLVQKHSDIQSFLRYQEETAVGVLMRSLIDGRLQ